ncbi:transcriptional regulator [Enemella dayhoffiae]|uniref:Transcriptional regulator n=1 Tax=Enemella dayhoffiae TaxID=2016507 RepID=A0A255GPW1_9ACTN|nr:helix-turn-helix transcriptional regulator [Enemella dayhoffiae]OYO16606.1 transcriptional regulator [Enemella dayhoffiae]
MRLNDPNLLRRYMDDRDFSQARLARYAGCSRQFIWQLLNDPTRRTCTQEVGRRIEEALNVLEGTLFTPNKSPDTRPSVTQKTTAA